MGDSRSVPLVIRPEDLTRREPSRIAATQTLGGAFVDNFGPGLASINISGHTGWRGGQTADGFQAFTTLKSTIFDLWHSRRARAAEAGANPDLVSLIFSDALDEDVRVVVPVSFTLKRSRSRPLLMMYQIEMIAISADVDAAMSTAALPSPAARSALGIASISNSMAQLGQYQGQLATVLPPGLAGQCGGFMATGQSVFGAALDGVTGAGSVIDLGTSHLLSVAADIAQAGRNAMWMLSATIGPTIQQLALLSQIAASFMNVFCTILNSFELFLTYLDYSDLYGASACSSTAGGSPLSPLRGINPFTVLALPATQPVFITPASQSAIGQMRAFDPVLNPQPSDQVGGLLETASDGITVA